jgi:hypothetical protein
MTDLIQRLRADADSCPVGDQYTADLEREAADALERLSEIPCIVESPDGNPGWSTIGDAVKLLAAARRERDEVLAKTHDGTLWQPAYMLLMEERDRLRAQLPTGMEHCTIVFKECEVGHGRLTATNWVDHGCDTCERDRLRAALEGIAAVRYGLELRDTDEEAMRYWFTLCQEYRRIAREALRK